MVLCGLVLILRAVIAEREALAMRVYQPGVLDRHGFEKGLDRELSRAGRHARPLTIALLEVSGALDREAKDEDHERVVTAVARSILGRIRAEDSVAYMSGLQFAVLAPETSAEGAASVCETITDVVRKRLLTLGYESSSFDIAVGWADYPHRAQSRNELLGVARAYLEAAVVQNELRPSAAAREAVPGHAPGDRRSRLLLGHSSGDTTFAARGTCFPAGIRQDSEAVPADRLTALDSSFLHLEDAASHMHVASVTIFEGPPPTYEEFLGHIESRLSLVPRYRQKLRFVPLNQGRPVWVDDPHFNLEYHVRATALPPPGSEEQLKSLAEPRVLSAARPRPSRSGRSGSVQGLERGESSPTEAPASPCSPRPITP